MKKMIILMAMAIASFSCIMCTNNGGIPVESNWTVETLYVDGKETAIPEDHNATLAFLKDSKIAGDTGCNRFFGEYKIEGKNLSFSNMGSTRMMCPDIQFENAYLQGLANTAQFKTSNGKLMLLSKSGEIIALFSQIEPTEMEN